MNADPAPEMTLSADDAALATAEAQLVDAARKELLLVTLTFESQIELVAIARRLQAENRKLRETANRLERAATVADPNGEGETALQTMEALDVKNIRLERENAAITERLRVAEAERVALKISLMFARAVKAPASDAAPKEATDAE